MVKRPLNSLDESAADSLRKLESSTESTLLIIPIHRYLSVELRSGSGAGMVVVVERGRLDRRKYVNLTVRRWWRVAQSASA